MDIELDDTGDLALSSGTLQTVTGADAIAQHMRIRLRTFLGEWFLDERQGIPFFRDVFTKSPNLSLVESELRQTIERTPGVSTLRKFALDVDAQARTLEVKDWEVVTSGGDTLRSEDYGPLILEV